MFPVFPTAPSAREYKISSIHAAVPAVPIVPGEKHVVMLDRHVRDPLVGDPAAWEDELHQWTMARCVFGDRALSGLTALHRDYVEWSHATRNKPLMRDFMRRQFPRRRAGEPRIFRQPPLCNALPLSTGEGRGMFSRVLRLVGRRGSGRPVLGRTRGGRGSIGRPLAEAAADCYRHLVVRWILRPEEGSGDIRSLRGMRCCRDGFHLRIDRA